MSRGFEVYPDKVRNTVSDLENMSSQMGSEIQALRDVLSQIRNSGSYGYTARNLSNAISANEKYMQSIKKMHQVLSETILLYENTEKRIVSNVDGARQRDSTDEKVVSDVTGDSEDGGFWDYIGTALWQAFAGDFTDESNGLGIVLSVVIGFVPIVGQVADVRDLIADIYNLIDDGPETSEWVALGFTVVGLLPGIGDFLKNADKLEPVLKHLDDISEALGDATRGVIRNADEIFTKVDDVVKRFNDIFDEKVVSHVMDKFDDMLENVPDVKKAAQGLQTILKKEINGAGDTVADFVKELCKEASGIEDKIQSFISDGIDSIFRKDDMESVGAAKLYTGGFSTVVVA